MHAKDMELAIIRTLPAKTGKAIEQWVAILNQSGPMGKSARIAWLKSTYRLGHFQARAIASWASKATTTVTSDAENAESMFSSASEDALSVYALVLGHLRSFGEDIRAIPSEQHISFIRTRLFLVLKPEGNRVVVGLCLPQGLTNARVVPPTEFGSMPDVSHQIILNSPMDVDNVVTELFKMAYAAS